MIGAHFSKPDWNNEDYWWPYFPPKDRNVNYDPAKHPEHWKAFSQVPSHPMDDPWESCLTMGNSWSYVPNDHYKSSTELIHLLVKIVSRGGNFLLNAGPSPQGDWDDTAYSRLKEMGAWLKINGEGIYNSKPVRPYASENIFLTQSKNAGSVYAFYLGEGKDVILPAELSIDKLTARKNSRITMLGFKGSLKWRQEGKKLVISIPAAWQNKVIAQHAVVFKIS